MDNFVLTTCLLNGLLMLLTIMGNVLVLTAMLTTPSLRSPSTIFLCSLAASDLLVGFVVQPIYIGFRLDPGPELEYLAYIFVSLGCSVSLCKLWLVIINRTWCDGKEVLSTPLYITSVWFCFIFRCLHHCYFWALTQNSGAKSGIWQWIWFLWTRPLIQFCIVGVYANFDISFKDNKKTTM